MPPSAAQGEATMSDTAEQGAGWDARLKKERSPAFHGCQFGKKAPIPGQFSSPFGFSVV